MHFYYNLLVFGRAKDQQGVSGYSAIMHQALEHMIWILEEVKVKKKKLNFLPSLTWDFMETLQAQGQIWILPEMSPLNLRCNKNRGYSLFSILDIKKKEKKKQLNHCK